MAQQSIETLRGSHGRFDVDCAHVLPVLFQQRHQKVDGQRNVGDQFLRRHINVANGDGQAQNLKMVGTYSKESYIIQDVILFKRTFFIWNLIVALVSSTFDVSGSEWVTTEGNLPALFRPGPKIRGICLISDSDAKKAS